MPIEFRSQFGEDALIWSLFDGKTDGFFIEVGAFDGYTYSTSYGLEAAGWTGLLIEAIPERYEQCVTRRPHARVVNAALGKRGSTGTATFTVVQDQHGGMLSYHTTDERHLADLRQGQYLKKTVSVPFTTMDAILETHPKAAGGEGEFRINAASIDVEGGELNLLDGFDLARWKPTALLVEDNSKGQSALGKEVIAFLTRAGYTRVGWLFVNGVFVRKDAKETLARALAFMNP
jgi:FkbM family methyltransferase